jgi:transcriptional regulator with XRE-family HTH domain
VGEDHLRERPGFYEALGHAITVLRTEQRIDRRALAERIGISYSYLAGIENGKKKPSSSVLLALAEALGLRSHELLAEAEARVRPAPPPAAAAAPASPRGRSLFAPLSRAVADRPEENVSEPEPEGPADAAGTVEELAELTARLHEDDRRFLLQMARRMLDGG